MNDYLMYWMIIFSLAYTKPDVPPLPQGRLATPEEMSAHINTKMLNSCRQMLLLTYFSRVQLENDKRADYRKAIESSLRIEEDLKQRIAELERRMQGPRLAPLPVLPDPNRKKPPVRD